MLKKIQQFLLDVQFELKKVSWPTWEELRGSTFIVLSLSVLLGIFLFVVDIVLSRVLTILL
ncbi:MAG: preprotein translocase subunit SecE [Candidatus Marinimicrobia bacterium]|nr:preprotein translocase subunit SecE [Candidatus Neomarinimicrobiota bacterium]